MHGTAVLLEIFDNRIEVSSPGEPTVPVERLIDGMHSRNERFADLMRRIGVCERRGSGIDKVVDAAESLHLPPPEFRSVDKRMLATIYGPRDFEDMDRAERIRACVQHCALKWETAARMTNQSLRKRFNLQEDKINVVSQVIGATIEAGLSKADEGAGSSRRFARYRPIWT